MYLGFENASATEGGGGARRENESEQVGAWGEDKSGARGRGRDESPAREWVERG